MPIFNGNIKVKLSGIKDAYFGTVKIYASAVPVTITYSTEHGTAPASKVVNSGYVLTEEDLPALTDSGYKFLGWDASAGTVVTSDMTITAAWSARELVSIALSNQITSIDRKEAFDFGGTVTATFDNGTTEDVTSSTTFSGYDMSVAGTYDVVASYTSGEVTKSATYSLTVNKIWETIWSGTMDPFDLQRSSEYSPIKLFPANSDVFRDRDVRITWSTTASGTAYYRTFLTSENQYANTTSKPDNPFSGTPTWYIPSGSSKYRTYPLLKISTSSLSDNGFIMYIRQYTNDYWLNFYGSSRAPSGTITVTKLEQYF